MERKWKLNRISKCAASSFLNLTIKIFLLLLKRLSHAKVFIIAEEKTDSDQ